MSLISEYTRIGLVILFRYNIISLYARLSCFILIVLMSTEVYILFIEQLCVQRAFLFPCKYYYKQIIYWAAQWIFSLITQCLKAKLRKLWRNSWSLLWFGKQEDTRWCMFKSSLIAWCWIAGIQLDAPDVLNLAVGTVDVHAKTLTWWNARRHCVPLLWFGRKMTIFARVLPYKDMVAMAAKLFEQR